MTAPAFELEMQEPPRMNERLMSLADLAGETILVAFEGYECRDDRQTVIVTDTFNWIVLEAESDSCGEAAQITVPHTYRKDALSDFVPPRKLFDAGCINAEVYTVLQEAEDANTAAATAAKAKRLRDELAMIEKAAS